MNSGKYGKEKSGFIIRQESLHLADQLLCIRGEGIDSLLHGVSPVKQYIKWIHIDQNKTDLITSACKTR
jgi:hypothetical protein